MNRMNPKESTKNCAENLVGFKRVQHVTHLRVYGHAESQRPSDIAIRTALSQSSQIVGSTGVPSAHLEPPRRSAISSPSLPCRSQAASRNTRIASQPSSTVILSVALGTSLVNSAD